MVLRDASQGTNYHVLHKAGGSGGADPVLGINS